MVERKGYESGQPDKIGRVDPISIGIYYKRLYSAFHQVKAGMPEDVVFSGFFSDVPSEKKGPLRDIFYKAVRSGKFPEPEEFKSQLLGDSGE